jgi:hypothetical protein
MEIRPVSQLVPIQQLDSEEVASFEYLSLTAFLISSSDMEEFPHKRLFID